MRLGSSGRTREKPPFVRLKSRSDYCLKRPNEGKEGPGAVLYRAIRSPSDQKGPAVHPYNGIYCSFFSFLNVFFLKSSTGIVLIVFEALDMRQKQNRTAKPSKFL